MRKEEYVQAFSQVHAPKALTEKLLQPKLRPNYTRKFAVLAAWAVFASILGMFLVGAASNQPITEATLVVDWTMYAALVNSEGEIFDRAEIRLSGKVYGNEDPRKADVHFETPKTFRYEDWPVPNWINQSISGSHDDLAYYVWQGYDVDRKKKDIVFGNTVLCVEKQYLLVDWDDGEDVYLVASSHSGTEYVDILQYFADYFEQQYAYGGKDR